MERLREWHEWYDFARETLEYEHDEAASYADARYLEETNRDRLARRPEHFAVTQLARDDGA